MFSKKLEDALSVADLRKLAKARLPKILFELIESGVEDEYCVSRNESAFHDYCLLPRYLSDIHERDQRMTLFGQTYASPFGIAPTGFAALLRPDADQYLAAAARSADLPIIMSGASAARIEDMAGIAERHLWYHLYPAKDKNITFDILRRVADAGISTLVLTVDNPVYPKRERDIRNGFKLPLRLRPRTIYDGLTHPSWLLGYLRAGGMPMMETWARYAPKASSAGEVAAFFRSQSPSIQTWRELDELRAFWDGRFVLKGIQHPDDAEKAVDAGIDGIIVSNHGGKSYDPLPSPLSTLPSIKDRVGHRVPVMFDSGIRRGADILIARCLGADFCFVGRATLYGAVAAGLEGVEKAIAILRGEIDTGLAMVGCRSVAELDEGFLWPPRKQRAEKDREAPIANVGSIAAFARTST